MDKRTPAEQILAFTRRLVPQSKVCGNRLDQIRQYLIYNVENNLQQIPTGLLERVNIPIEAIEEEFSQSDEKAESIQKRTPASNTLQGLNPDEIPIVNVRTEDTRFPINLAGSKEEWRWNQRREEVGPYLTPEGAQIWFDLFYYQSKLTVRAENGFIPHFLFSNANRSTWQDALNISQTVELSAGHVWIYVPVLTNDLNDSGYVGFKIESGKFVIQNDKDWKGNFLDYSGPFNGSLTLNLVQATPNEVAFEGCSAAQEIDFEYPSSITFGWVDGILKEVIADDGQFEGYGNAFSFGNYKSSVINRLEINHLLIPCKPATNTWTADFTSSEIFEAQGATDIKDAYWALPVVTVSNVATLGVPENNGGWMLELLPGFRTRWIGLDGAQPEAHPQAPIILIYPQGLLFHSPNTEIDTSVALKIQQTFNLWQIHPDREARIKMNYEYRDTFLQTYYCHATEGEILANSCLGRTRLDRPVLATGLPIDTNEELVGSVIFSAKGNGLRIISLLYPPEIVAILHAPRQLLALENALLTTTKSFGILLQGRLGSTNRGNVQSGVLGLVLGLIKWKPILPDPYISNLQEGWGKSRKNYITGNTLSEGISARLNVQIQWDETASPRVIFDGTLPIRQGVGIAPSSDPAISGIPLSLSDEESKNVDKYRINDERKADKEASERVFDELEKRLVGWKLLDVSTNMDLIGVSVSPFLYSKRPDFNSGDHQLIEDTIAANNAPAGVIRKKYFASDIVVKEMAMHTPLAMVNVFTLPQVQWEPVRTLPEDQNIDTLGWFPEQLSSASDGGPTRLIGVSEELAPVIPDIVMRQIQNSFRDGQETIALTTLAFGLKAGFYLIPQNTEKRNADAIDIIRPDFSDKSLKGGIQVHLSAESGTPKHPSPSPGFEGIMVQTLNGYELSTGTELGLSVLGATFQPGASVETQFNNEFAFPSDPSQRTFVPVTRFDLSGYGASNFSDWENEAALASIGKVKFNITVGRTSLMIVKFVSVIYPWAIVVTRSVTIERRSSGGVVRKDSGWQATQSGVFDFRAPDAITDNPYDFRPGLFRGCFNVVNIRPASDDIIEFIDTVGNLDVELAPVYFDAEIKLDGQEEDKVLSTGILGFIQLEPKPDKNVNPWKPRLLSTEAFEQLIKVQGAIGGPIDTLLNIGNSGVQFRATRFEVDVTKDGMATNFVGVIRGQPILPNNGSWSVVKMAAPNNTIDPQEATSADISKGTPLFIANTWQPATANKMNVSGPSGPYRLADPADFFSVQPRFDYGLLQNTGSQAFLFRRPVIAPGANEITSSLPPAFADPFALLTSKGVFPPITNAILAPPANYKLLTQAGTSQLRLSPSIIQPNPRSPLVLTQDGTDQILIEYGDAELRVDIDYETWDIALDKFVIWTTLLGIERFSGLEFNLIASDQQSARLIDNLSLLKEEIQDALNFLPGMGGPREAPDVDLGMTNGKHEVKVHSGFECKIDFLKRGKIECKPGKKIKPTDGQTYANDLNGKSTKELWLKFKASVGVDSVKDTKIGIWEAFFGATLGAELQGKLPIGGPFFLLLGLRMEVGLRSSASPTSSSSTPVRFKSLEVVAYVGVGFGGKVGPFSGRLFIAAGVIFVYENDKVKLGGLVRMQGDVDLKIVIVNIYAELKGLVYKGDYEGETNINLLEATGFIGINVSILFVINIKATYSTKCTRKL